MSTLSTPRLRAQCVAEFTGTALILFFGTGCVAAAKVAGASLGQWEISIIWGLAVSMAVYFSAGLSGAHLSPAVTLAFWLFGDFDKRKVPAYMVSQVAGAFFGAAVVYMLYQNLIVDAEQAHHIVRGSKESLELAGIFSTYPNPAISVGQAFLTEIIITAILLAGLMTLSDDLNGLPRGALAPLLSGLLIAVIGASMGPLTGFALNPARDLGPKIMAWMAGWGEVAFTGGREIPYFLVPVFGPLIGGCLGAAAYRLLISRHLPQSTAGVVASSVKK
ncbi:MIP/aquaporin family protein [Erwinia sp.]|uniref:MIP/aquaporin family protein n=1 Tax=Erwinia citreus TaxID=558 RepID=UPI002896BD67|nr:MIP/aquaporin family protein [Erwinia sp.]